MKPTLRNSEGQAIERRFLPGAKFELRASEGGGPGICAGYPIVFNSLSVDFGGWKEEIAPGAFDATLKNGRTVYAFFNHNADLVLGRLDAETMTLAADEKGYLQEITLPDTTYGRDLAVSLARGDVRGGSMMFQVLPGGSVWREESDGMWVRRVVNAVLYECGPVTMPAYLDTEFALRELRSWQEQHGRPAVDLRAMAASRRRQLEILALA